MKFSVFPTEAEPVGPERRTLIVNVPVPQLVTKYVQLRCCEVALAITDSQFELASQLIDRHKKWLRMKRYTLDVTSCGYFFSYATEMIEREQTGKKIKTSTIEKFKKRLRLRMANLCEVV